MRGGGSHCLEEADLSFSRSNAWAESEEMAMMKETYFVSSALALASQFIMGEGRYSQNYTTRAEILGFSFTWRWGMESISVMILGLCWQYPSVRLVPWVVCCRSAGTGSTLAVSGLAVGELQQLWLCLSGFTLNCYKQALRSEDRLKNKKSVRPKGNF